MNDNVKAKAEELIRAIRESDEYRTFEHNKMLLNQNPELSDRVRTFRKARIETEYSGRSGKEISDLLVSQYIDILNNTIAANYLNSELEVCRMVQCIDEILMGGIQLELDFL